MRALPVVLALGLLLAGCAAKKPEAPAPPQATAGAPAAPPETAKTTPPAASRPPAPAAAKPTASASGPAARTSKPAATPVTAAPVARAAAPVAPAPLDLIALKEELKATKAIGVFTKVSLKNKVDDLMAQFRVHYRGKTPPTMADLRQSYDLLIMKVLSLLQDSDKQLASKIVSSREAIWALLADPKKFAALDA